MEANNKPEEDNGFRSSNNSGKILSGVIVVAVGSVLLANKLGAEIPRWVISWEVLLICIGFYVGAKHSFRTWGWMIPVLIGSVFLVDHIVLDIDFRPYLWPIAIIGAGLYIIFNPGKIGRGRKGRREKMWGNDWGETGTRRQDESDEEYLNSISIFGGVEKNIVSKDFRGGEVTTLFGGSSINLSQADIKDRAVLELTQLFGGAKLIIPSNWRLQSEMVSVFGGIEDKRVFQKEQGTEQAKTLILRGTSVFGGIEIKSY